MAKPKSKNKEDIAAKKREREKQRYQKIKNNPELYAEYQRKKYEKRKEQKKIVPINEMTSRQQRMQRKKWREERNRRYQRMKDKKAKEKQFIAENSPPESDAEVAQLLNAPEGNAEVDIQNVQGCKENGLLYGEFDNSIDVVYWKWGTRTQTIKCKNGKNKLVRLVKKEQHEIKPLQAVEYFETLLPNYIVHCGKIVNQQRAMAEVKRVLTPGEAIMHIDFSENYKCQYFKEIQSAHFGGSKPQISIHTSVLYFYDLNETKQTQCYATLSPSLRHDTAAVWAHIEPLLNYLQNHSTDIKTLHIFSDSATSQYRNFKIYFVISSLKRSLPSLTHVTWNFSEAGHGKGAPDGVGAVIKRTADASVSCGNDVPDYETFIQVLKKDLNNIIIESVMDQQIDTKDKPLPKDLPRFKGTQEVHQILWNITNCSTVALRRLSCTYPSCLYTINICTHGKHIGFHSLEKKVAKPRKPTRKNVSNIVSPIRYLTPTVESNVNCSQNDTPSNLYTEASDLDIPSELRNSDLDSILRQGIADTFNDVNDSDTDSSYNIFE